MVPTLALEQFEDLFAGAKQAPEGGFNATIVASACHSHAPFYIVYIQGSGKAGLKCAFCGEVFAELMLGRALIVLAKGNGMGTP